MKTLLISVLMLSGLSCATVNRTIPVNEQAMFCRTPSSLDLYSLSDVTVDTYKMMTGEEAGTVISHCVNGKCQVYTQDMCNVLVKTKEDKVQKAVLKETPKE